MDTHVCECQWKWQTTCACVWVSTWANVRMHVTPHGRAIIADLTASQCALPEPHRIGLNPAYARTHMPRQYKQYSKDPLTSNHQRQYILCVHCLQTLTRSTQAEIRPNMYIMCATVQKRCLRAKQWTSSCCSAAGSRTMCVRVGQPWRINAGACMETT